MFVLDALILHSSACTASKKLSVYGTSAANTAYLCKQACAATRESGVKFTVTGSESIMNVKRQSDRRC